MVSTVGTAPTPLVPKTSGQTFIPRRYDIEMVSNPGIEPEPCECQSHIQTTKLVAHFLVPPKGFEPILFSF
jgi:hypothetical protein